MGVVGIGYARWSGVRWKNGAFHRVVHLPVSVDADKARAAFSDGLLTITLPKKERERGKKIEVKAS